MLFFPNMSAVHATDTRNAQQPEYEERFLMCVSSSQRQWLRQWQYPLNMPYGYVKLVFQFNLIQSQPMLCFIFIFLFLCMQSHNFGQMLFPPNLANQIKLYSNKQKHTKICFISTFDLFLKLVNLKSSKYCETLYLIMEKI